MPESSTATPYELLGGASAVDALVDAFYRRMDTLPEAAGIRAIHKDLDRARSLLKLYLKEWTGGPKDYTASRGHPRLRARHLPFPIGSAERDQWLLCMKGALEETVPDAELREHLLQAFSRLADWMRNKPGDLPAAPG